MIALVTGANKGIGFAVASKLVEFGHTVYMGVRSMQKGQLAHEKMGNLPNVKILELDVSNEASCINGIDKIRDIEGRLDILVNNAGINYDTWHNSLNADLLNVSETLETNLFGPWRLMQLCIPLMERNRYGRIVNVSSGAGAFSGLSSGTPGYSISKAALNMLTVKTAQLVSKEILVNSVCPGWVRTDMGGSGAPRSPEKGAETIVWAATLADGAPSGKFFRDKREVSF